MLDTVAGDYLDDLRFVAVAGRSDERRTAARAEQLFSDRLDWVLADDLWRAYDVPYQPVSIIVRDGVIVDRWDGALGEERIRERIDAAIAG